MKNKLNKKFYILFYIIMTLMVVSMASITFAYYKAKVTGTTTVQSGTVGTLKINYLDEQVLTVTNAKPIYENGYKEYADKLEFTIKGTGSNITGCYKLELDITRLDAGLKNADFRWILYDKTNSKAVSGGNFSSAVVGTPLLLLDKQTLISTTDVDYALYVFIKYNETSNQISMMNTTFSGSIRATGSVETCTNGTKEISMILPPPATGTYYTNGRTKDIVITGVNCGELTCSSNNNSVAICEPISTSSVRVIPKATAGTATITIKESNGNYVSYIATVNAMPTITLNNQSATTGGTASVKAEPGYAMPTINVPAKTGYTFGGYWTAANGSGTQYYNINGTSAKNSTFTSNTTLYAKWNEVTLTIPAVTAYYIGRGAKTVTVTKSSNAGALSVTSGCSTSIATCSLNASTGVITITPVAAGSTSITIKEANGNKTATHQVVVQTTTLTLTSTGTYYIGGGAKTITATKSSNAGVLSITSGCNTSIATCSLNASTGVITINPMSVGSTSITIKEANGNKTAKHTITVAGPTLVWQQRYGSQIMEEFYGVASTSDGGTVAVGYTSGYISDLTSYGGYDGIIVKYNSNGNKTWQKSYGGTSIDVLKGVTITNNIMTVVGSTYSIIDGITRYGERDVIIVKYTNP